MNNNTFIVTKSKIDTNQISKILNDLNENQFHSKLEIDFLPEPQNLWGIEYISSNPPITDRNVWVNRMIWLEEPNKLEITRIGRNSQRSHFANYLEASIINQILFVLKKDVLHFKHSYEEEVLSPSGFVKNFPSYQEYIETFLRKTTHPTVIGATRERIYSLSPPEFQQIKNKPISYMDKWIPFSKELEERGYKVEKPLEYKYTISSILHGKVDYYPKKNRLFVRVDHTWHDNGFEWLKNTFVVENE